MGKSRTERMLEDPIIKTPEAFARLKAIMELPPYKIGQPLFTDEQVRKRNEFVDRRTKEILAEMMQPEIVLYTTHCPLCEQLEKELKKNNIPYSIETDTKKMIELGFYSAPTLQVGDEYFNFTQAIAKLRKGEFCERQ